MIPFLHIWHLNVPTFGLMLWCAAVAAAIVMDKGFKRVGVDADAVGMVAIAVVAGIIGAKLWHVIDTPSEFREIGWRVLWDSAGFAWFGGLVFGISALVAQGWWSRIGALKTLDLAAPAAAIGYGIGRIGCFLSGDGCYGIETKLPWGMSFPKRNRTYPAWGPGTSNPALRIRGRAVDRVVALVARRQTAWNGCDCRRVPGAQWDCPVSG